jgi:hypothetical protein
MYTIECLKGTFVRDLGACDAEMSPEQSES